MVKGLPLSLLEEVELGAEIRLRILSWMRNLFLIQLLLMQIQFQDNEKVLLSN